MSDLNSRLPSDSSLLNTYSGSSSISSSTMCFLFLFKDLYKVSSTKSTPKLSRAMFSGNKLAKSTSRDLALQEPFIFSPARRTARRFLRVSLTLSDIQVEKKEAGDS